MDFEVLAGSTTPPLALDTLRLRDPMCKPAFRSPSNDRAWFHVPLRRCGTRYWVSSHCWQGGASWGECPQLMLLSLLSLKERR